MTGDLYVQTVIGNLPYGSPLRDQIAMELHSNIAERVAHGDPLDGVLRQLGDPLTLAESYLASIPLTAAAPPRAFRPDRVRARRALRLPLVHGRHRVPYGMDAGEADAGHPGRA